MDESTGPRKCSVGSNENVVLLMVLSIALPLILYFMSDSWLPLLPMNRASDPNHILAVQGLASIPTTARPLKRPCIYSSLSSVPAWFYITTNASRPGALRLEADLVRYGLRSRPKIVHGVRPKDFEGEVGPWVRFRRKSRPPVEIAVLLAHLRAFREAWSYLKTSGNNWVVISEEDVSFEYVALWSAFGTSLKGVIAELDSKKNIDWEVCQLGISVDEYNNVLLSGLQKTISRGKIIEQRHKGMEPWGAFAYAVHRRGLEATLNKLWPGGANGPEWSSLTKEAVFDFRRGGDVSEKAIYANKRRAFIAAPPLISYHTSHTEVHILRNGTTFGVNTALKSKEEVSTKLYGAADRGCRCVWKIYGSVVNGSCNCVCSEVFFSHEPAHDNCTGRSLCVNFD